MCETNLGGQVVHYVDEGTGDVLLILPDHLHAARAYEQEIAHFSDRYRVVCLDYPGTGRSVRQLKHQDEREYDLWNYHADLACHLLMDLHIEACYVMGTGFGALAALHFAGKQAQLHGISVLGAVADSFLSDLDPQTLHRALDKREHYYVRRVAWLERQHGSDWREVVDADTRFLRRMADRGGYAVPEGVLKGITAPVLLTGNVRDDVVPGVARDFARLAALIPDCGVFLVGQSGDRYGEQHPLVRTSPVAFRHAVDCFLSDRV